MKFSRMDVRIALLATFLFAPFALAEPLPTYRELDNNGHAPRRLRRTSSMLLQFPTMFSIAKLADSNVDDQRVRTVDVNGQVWQWSRLQPDEPTRVAETNSQPLDAVLSPDARRLGFADPDGSVALMDLDTSEIKFRDTSEFGRTVALRFSPDSDYLVGATERGRIHAWHVGTGKLVQELTAGEGPIQTIAFSPDCEKLAIASHSQDVTLYDIRTENGLQFAPDPRVIRIGSSRVTAFAFSPAGNELVIAASDGSAAVHDLTMVRDPIALATHPFAIWSIAFEANGDRMVAGSWDGTVRLWDSNSWELLQSVKNHEESVVDMLLDAKLGLLSVGLDGRFLYWSNEIPSVRPAAVIAGRADSVWVAVYSPNGKRLFVGGRDKRFELWDMERKTLVATRDGHPTTRCAVFSPDGDTLATGGDDGKIFLNDVETGETRQTLLRHPGSVSAVVFTADGNMLMSGCDGGLVKTWDVRTGREIATWREHKQQIYCANLSPDGKSLITGGGNWTTDDPGELVVWEASTGRVRAKLEGHKLAVWTIVFTPDGQHFATSDSSGAVKIWKLDTLEQVRTLQHETWIRALAMSPRGDTLAVGRGDGSVRLWDTTTWSQRASCEGHSSFTFWLQYAPDGKTLATSGEDGTVRFWGAD